VKGDSTTHIYTEKGQQNHDRVAMTYEPVGPYHIWRNRYYPDKTMKLPVGVSAGRDWVRVLDAE
jgi:hypothetical protein